MWCFCSASVRFCKYPWYQPQRSLLPSKPQILPPTNFEPSVKSDSSATTNPSHFIPSRNFFFLMSFERLSTSFSWDVNQFSFSDCPISGIGAKCHVFSYYFIPFVFRQRNAVTKCYLGTPYSSAFLATDTPRLPLLPGPGPSLILYLSLFYKVCVLSFSPPPIPPDWRHGHIIKWDSVQIYIHSPSSWPYQPRSLTSGQDAQSSQG